MKHLVLLFSALILSAGVTFGQCTPEIAPWVETFAGTTTPTCWTQSATSGGPWVFTGTPGYDVSSVQDHTLGGATNFAWIDFSGTDAGVILTTPEIDVTALTVPELVFWTVSHYTGSLTPYNFIHVEANDGVGGWTPVLTLQGETGFPWVENIINATPYIYGANLVQFRFRAESGGASNDFNNDLLIDDVEVREAPTCPQPSGLVANTVNAFDANFGWTDNAGASQWEIEYGPTGFIPGTGAGTTMLTTNNPETVTGLTPTTDYDFYVRAVCSPGDSSNYNGPVSITTLVSCPQPTAFQINYMDTTEAILNWTAGGTETEWLIEWGAVGFTPGTGNSFTTMDNPDTLTGLPQDSLFEVYVTAICAVADSSLPTGPAVTNTYGYGAYFVNDNQCGPGFNDISATGVATNINDDGEVGLAMPFPFFYQNQIINDITIADNGVIVLGTQTANVGFGNGALGTQQQGIYVFWDDIEPNLGDIYWQVVGTSPNQQLVVQWNEYSPWNASGGGTWQVVFDEATADIYAIYEDVEFNGGGNDFGGSATIGADGPQTIQLSLNNNQYLQDNSCIRYFYSNCPLPTNYAVTYTTTDEAAITWSPGLSNESDWTVIYGPQGFDPQTGGTTIQTSTNALVINPLDDGTIYDVYIYADCNPTLQSDPLVGTFETLPNCADPTGLAGATAVDSIFTSWNWTGNAGFPIAEYAIEYGPTGYTNGMGTQVYGIDTINTTDTLFDATLMSGGLYDVYVQAVCMPDDTSNWVGPITVTMPLTNDSTCLAQAIPVDGVDYSFNGTGATVAAGELAIAPPAGPCDGNMTWCNSSVTASTWYTFVAPASGNVRINGDYQAFDGQVAVYETSDCNDFNQYNLIGANDDFNLTGDDYPYLNLCGLTPGNTYYMMHDPNGAAGIYSLSLSEVVVEAGTDNGLLNVCLGDTVDLNTQLTGADAGGTWTEDIPTAGFNDPIWASTGLASQVYTFQYMVVDGCATDSMTTSVEIYAPSSAGNDGTIDACQNEPVDLLQGLIGSPNVDVTGTWYDPQSNALATSEIITEAIPGQYNYQYIAGNGVCPDDTSIVTVIVDPNCDYLNLQDLTFNGMDIYPNPTTNVFYISNEGSTEVYNYELTDLNGKVIATKEAAITGVETTEVNVEKLETGVYLIRIFNENAEKTFRVVKQ